MNSAPEKVPAQGAHILMGLLRTFLRPYSWQAGIVLVLLTFQAISSLYLPDLYANIINNGVLTGDTAYIWRSGGIMLAILGTIGVASVVTVYWASRVSMGSGADMRSAIYKRVQAFSVQEMHRFGIPSLITRNTNDIQQVQIFLDMMIVLLVPAIITSVGGVIMAIRESAVLSLLLVVAVPAIALAIVPLLIAIIPLFRSIQAMVDRINEVVREQITGVRVIRAFGRTRSEEDRFEQANGDLTWTMLRATRIFALVIPIMTVILSLSSVGVVWFGGRLVSEGSMPLGNVGAFLTYIMQILIAVLVAGGIAVQFPRSAASAERLREVIDEIPAVGDPSSPVIPASASGAVELRNVTFGYPGSEHPVVRDLTLVIRPGQTTGIIGGIGSGKSTLVNLIPRFIDATSGAVLVNETDVRSQSTERLWATIGLVPQTAFLFRGTVASNLRFGAPQATDEELWRALTVAQASDFVASMPGALDAPIDQGGTNVSTGQRQRLSIARALVRRPCLYLFDDCFSALDADTDARLRDALRAETQGVTQVIVAQRISTIMHADQILVLDAGSVAGIGTHVQLLADCSAYREIAASQLGEGISA